MKRSVMSAARVACAVAFLFVAACGEDSPGPSSSSGASAGTGGSSDGGTTANAGTGGGGGTVEPAGCVIPGDVDEQPTLLSETHCVDMNDPSVPAPGLLAYAINSPLWSDGATKERFFALPEGGKIGVKDCDVSPDLCLPLEQGGSTEDEGDWDMPVGTVLVKNFSIDGTRIETRLLMRLTESQWKGFSYEWNDEGTEATLLDDEKDKDLGSQVWHYPSSAQCLECHTKATGRSLGPSTAQFDRDFDYADGTMNQLDKLAELGVFAAPLKAIPAYPDPYGDAPLADRARSYLQTNCSICHRPGGPLSDVDLRFETAFPDTHLCNEAIIRGTGDPLLPQVRLVPGAPEESSLSFRMHDTTSYRMPRIGSSVVDADGVELIDAWISAMTGCE